MLTQQFTQRSPYMDFLLKDFGHRLVLHVGRSFSLWAPADVHLSLSAEGSFPGTLSSLYEG